MRKLSLLILGLLSCGIILCQTETYDITNYLYHDFERKTLSLSPTLDFQSVNNDADPAYSFGSLRIIAFGTRIQNSRERQLDLQYTLGAGFVYNSDNFPFDRNQEGVNGTARLNIENRNFFKPKRFFEIESNVNLGYDDLSIILFGSQNSNEFRATGSVSPKLGFGRIEVVTDAWHAVTIIEELQKAGCLKKQLSHEELTAFANELRTIKNARNVDFRLENIYEFEQLSKYLIEQDYVDPTQYKFYPILDDAYSFEDFVNRRQGSAFTIGPRISLEYFDFGSTTVLGSSGGQLSLAIGYERNNAIDINWQFDQKYELFGGARLRDPLSEFDFSDGEFLTLSMQHTVGYYLSQRTNLRVPLFTTISRINETTSTSISLLPTLNYYFSPQLRFSVNGTLFLSRINPSLGDRLGSSRTRLNAGFAYFFY